jgi:hypothetical protein
MKQSTMALKDWFRHVKHIAESWKDELWLSAISVKWMLKDWFHRVQHIPELCKNMNGYLPSFKCVCQWIMFEVEGLILLCPTYTWIM